MFIVHNELEDGWMWVTNVRTEEQGLIVEDLVEEVVSKQESNQNVMVKAFEDWYFDVLQGREEDPHEGKL